MSLPAFEAPIAAPPVQASPEPAHARVVAARVPENPVVMPSVHANPFLPPAQASPVAPAEVNAVAPHVFENPVVMPSVHANPLMPPVQTNPVLSAAEGSPHAPAVHANRGVSPAAVSASPPAAYDSAIPPVVQPTPVEPAVRARSFERPVYTSPFEPREDVNPIVRPVVEERANTTPSVPRVVEPALSASIGAPSALEAPVMASPVIEATVVPPPVVEAPVVEAPVLASPAREAPGVEAPAQASTLVSASESPIVETATQANSFETAPTEVPVSETPIADPVYEDASLAHPQSVEAASAEEPGEPREADDENARQAADEGADEADDENAYEDASAAIETSAPDAAESVVGEAEIQEQPAVAARPFPAPARSFSSSGSEMPVVITTPAPYQRDGKAPAANLFAMGREFLPRAQAWSQKTLRTSPRTLVIAAPLVALLGIWAIRSATSHPKPAEVVQAKGEPTVQAAAPQSSAAAPVAPILVSTSEAPTAAPASADPAELASAVTHGLPALEALAHKFPNDPRVGIALASQQAQAQRFEAAIDSVERVINVDPKSAQNGKVMGILWRGAQSGASQQTFSLLRKLGARGSDIAFDLAITSGVRDSVRERAKAELGKSLAADASSDTRIASALLLAPDCSARKALLPRAESEGGKRTQKMLEGFSRGSLCTSSADKGCNSCLTGSPELSHALAQVSAGGEK